jgi:hypothetical protein
MLRRGSTSSRPSTAFIGDDVVVAHNAGFDMSVLRRACEATDAACPSYRYLCSLQVARKTYDLASYRLPSVAAAAGFLDFAHHDAASDALACAHIMIDAAARAGAHDVVELAMLLGVRVPRRRQRPARARRPGGRLNGRTAHRAAPTDVGGCATWSHGRLHPSSSERSAWSRHRRGWFTASRAPRSAHARETADLAARLAAAEASARARRAARA